MQIITLFKNIKYLREFNAYIKRLLPEKNIQYIAGFHDYSKRPHIHIAVDGIKAGEVDPKEVDEFIASCGTEYMSKYRTVPLSDLTKEFLTGLEANEEKMKEKLL